MSKNVEKYRLTLFKFGEEKRDVFLSECSSTYERFIHPICKATITFVSENFQRENKSKKEQNSKSPRVKEICFDGYSIFQQQMA